jgi:ketosteroid isomerase-like protein
MAQENVELLHRVYEAFNRSDLDSILALCDPDLEFTSRVMEVEGGGPYRGHDGVRAWWESIRDVAPDLRTEIEEVRDLGDVTITRLRVRGHGAGSRAPLDQTQWEVTRWRNRKMISWAIFLTETEALGAAGPAQRLQSRIGGGITRGPSRSRPPLG